MADAERNVQRLDTEAKIAAFFQLYGVDPATFKNTFNSFSVVAKVKRAEELVKRYQAQSTPTIIVTSPGWSRPKVSSWRWWDSR